MNFYEEFKIDPGLSRQEILKILGRESRKWASRVNAPDLERRQLAEKKIELLAQAEAIFKDDSSRAEYDRQLASNNDTRQERQEGQQRQEGQERQESQNYREYTEAAMELYRNKKGNEALDLALKATRLAPNEAESWNVLGIVQEGIGSEAEAIKSYLRALTIEPNNLVINANLGFIYLNLNRLEDSRKIADKLDVLDHEYSRANILMARILEKEANYDRAIEILETALAREEDNGDLKYNLSYVYQRKAYSYCHYNRSDSKFYIVDGDNIDTMVEYFTKANETYPDPAYERSIGWAQGHKEEEFDDKNRKFFLVPFAIALITKSVVGYIAAIFISYLFYKSSRVAKWERNREVLFGENITRTKLNKILKNLFSTTGSKMNEAKELIDSKLEEKKDSGQDKDIDLDQEERE